MGQVVNHMLAFYFAFFISGFFGGSIPTIMAFIADLFPDPIERTAKIGTLGGVQLLSMGLAGIIGKLLYDRTGQLFNGSFVAVGLSALAFVICLKVVPEPNREYRKQKALQGEMSGIRTLVVISLQT